MHFDIIDDEAMVRDMLRNIIAKAGYRVNTFIRASDYLEHLASPSFTPPAAAFVDIRMPGMDGLSLAHEIHKRFPEQKVVLISGTPMAGMDATCMMLPKPFYLARLFALLRALARCHNDGPRQLDRPRGWCGYGIEHVCPFSDAARSTGRALQKR